MRGKFRRLMAAFAAGIIVLLSGALPASAATSGGNGLRVSPVRTDITIKPGESQTVNVTVTNVTTKQSDLQVVINDFIANPNETGAPALILNPSQYAPSHSLKRFVTTPPNFTLAPGQQKSVPIKISVPSNAAGGGYYGAVRFAPASNINAKNETVSLAGSVGSLILAKVPGDIKEQLGIASFDARKNDRPSSFFYSGKDIDAVVRFQNSGNIQEEPFGKILLKNRSGKILAQYNVNNTVPPGNVLPDSIRKFPTPLGDKVGNFGVYKLEGNFGYGSNGQLLSASTTFYVIPKGVILGFILLVLLIVFLVIGLPKLIRRYNQRVISRAGRGRR
jgi:hypothetical protein